jgi:hypothetical protein
MRFHALSSPSHRKIYRKSSRIVRVGQEDERPTTGDRCVYKQERRAAQGADNALRDLTTGCGVPLRRLKRGPMELSAPSRYATRWASDGESGSHRHFLFRQDVWTMFRRQISEEITSTISTAWYFTTKSGGIGFFSYNALLFQFII